MSEEHEKPPYIIKRVKKKKHGHHGGAWKIAYADFVTAMMTFFLLMWLLTLMNHYQLEGIADYFKKPLSEAFKHESDQRNKGDKTQEHTETETEKEKEKEKNKEKETEKEKPQQIQAISNKNYQKQETNITQTKSMETIKTELEAKVNSDPVLSQFKSQLNFKITAEGLKIEIRDLKDKPMFTTGKTDFQKYDKPIINWLANELNKYTNKLVIIGDTDTASYHDDKGYSNWELSADRADAARRELVKNGMDQGKVIRVIGSGDTNLLDKKDGLNPTNRRIEIILLNDDVRKEISN